MWQACEPLTADTKQQRGPSLKNVKCIVHATKPVSADHVVKYRKAKIYFSSAASAETFRKKPEKYEAFANHQLVLTRQYVQQACPLSGEPPDEDSVILNVAGVNVHLLCKDCAEEIGSLPLGEQIETLFDAEGFKLGKFRLKKSASSEAKPFSCIRQTPSPLPAP